MKILLIYKKLSTKILWKPDMQVSWRTQPQAYEWSMKTFLKLCCKLPYLVEGSLIAYTHLSLSRL